ncbi:MAG TPA: outer membrane lipid asymmetry maintenance protein MlaD, partial [Gammaproteobacteria bacterium]|nr:outer membrane lipid asymmetry maintenance protein MlaD [Gammaproteobacteria bacterium]
ILTAGLLGDNYIELDPGFADEEFESQLLVEEGHISKENTLSPIVLEEIIAKFVSSEASGME